MNDDKLRAGVLCVVACAAAFIAQGRIVHTPMQAVRNAAGGTNPVTLANGAVWTLEGRSSAQDSAGALMTMDRTDSGAGFTGAALPCSLWGGTQGYPYVIECQGTEGISYGDGGLNPDEVAMHPGPPSSQPKCCSALAFKVPRSGRYSLSCTFRKSEAGTTDVWVLLDKVPLGNRELHAAGETFSCQFSNHYLLAGQELSFVVGPQFSIYEAEDIFYSDGIALKLEIVEEDEDEAPVAQTWDFASAFLANATREEPSMPFADPSGSGTWDLWAFDNKTPFVEMAGHERMTAFEDGEGCKRIKVEGDQYSLLLCTLLDNPGPVGLGTDSDHPWLSRAAPGVFCLRPGENRSLAIRFTVPLEGRYALIYVMEDACNGNSDDGVKIYTMAGGTFFGQDEISAEMGRGFVFGQISFGKLAAGVNIDLVIDSNSVPWDDETIGRLKIIRLAESVPEETMYQPGPALVANAAGANTNPFTDADGGIWTMGSSSAPGADFMPLTVFFPGDETALKAQWRNHASDEWWGIYPFIEFAKTYGQLTGEDPQSGLQSDAVLYPNEFIMHPSGGYGSQWSSAVLRFTAPQDGIYSMTASARDIEESDRSGVRLNFMAGGRHYLTKTLSTWNQLHHSGVLWTTVVPIESIYLREGDSIDTCVSIQSDRDINNDRTAVSEMIRVSPVPENEMMVGVDVRTDGGARSVLVERGRVGFGDQAWRATCPSNTVLSAVRLNRTLEARTTVGFTLARDGGETPVGANTGIGNPLMAKGVLSVTRSDTYTFKVTGLPPESEVGLYFYGARMPDGADPVFRVGSTSVSPSTTWFVDKESTDYWDVAVLRTKADAEGCVTGTFASSQDGAGAAFCGLQIVGTGFTGYVDPPLMIFIR